MLHGKGILGGKTSCCMALGIPRPVRLFVLERFTEYIVFIAVLYVP